MLQKDTLKFQICLLNIPSVNQDLIEAATSLKKQYPGFPRRSFSGDDGNNINGS